MKDPFLHRFRVSVELFGEVTSCWAELTKEAVDAYEGNPERIFSGREEVLFVCRPEDAYGAHHFDGRCAVRVYQQLYEQSREVK